MIRNVEADEQAVIARDNRTARGGRLQLRDVGFMLATGAKQVSS